MGKYITLHCWENGPETEDGCSTTCMMEVGHFGKHEWTRDDAIHIAFAAQEAVDDDPR